MKQIKGGVTAAKGYEAASTAAGIKYQGRTDMALIYSQVPCVSAGTFTTNVVKAAPVKWDRQIVDSGAGVQAVVVNSGIANACTGEEGMGYCKETAEAAAKALNIDAAGVLVGSTGVIGMQLPMQKLVDGIQVLAGKKAEGLQSGHDAALAIMTTDTVEKEMAVEIEIGGKTVTIGGMSKGSGMIHPNMCTMLAFITTDAAITKEALQKALSEDVEDTYNMMEIHLQMIQQFFLQMVWQAIRRSLTQVRSMRHLKRHFTWSTRHLPRKWQEMEKERLLYLR